MSSTTKDLMNIHGRIFNHKPFLKGEITSFLKNFENKRQDREVENIFKTLEHVTELKDCELDKLRAQCDSTLHQIQANLLVAHSMANKIICKIGNDDIEQALDSSRLAREKEWSMFMKDTENKYARINEAFNQREMDVVNQFVKMDKDLVKSQHH